MVEKDTKWLYLEPFITTKDYIHLADASKQLKKPHPTVRQYLNFFEKNGILLKTIKGRMTLYRIDYSNPLIIDYLTLIEKERLIKRCTTDLIFNEIISFLRDNLKEKNKSLIFGSSAIYSKKFNDIDLIVIGQINFENTLKDLEKKLNIKIHMVNVESLGLINESLKQEIKKKHLIVQGSEEIIKWLI